MRVGEFRYARVGVGGVDVGDGWCGIIYEYVLGLLGNNMMGVSHEQIFYGDWL